MDPIHADLIRKAAEAARAGDRERARSLLEEVLEEDDSNTQAWLLLARVTDNVDEQRMALSTVLQLDPGNERAQKLMDRLDVEPKAPEEDVIPGISRSQFRLIVISVGGVVAVIIILFLVITISNNNADANQRAEATRSSANATGTAIGATAVQLTNTQIAANATATLLAEVSATPTEPPTSSAPTLPPTITPTPLPSATPTLAPVTGLPGRLVAWGGLDLSGRGVLPLSLYNLENGGDAVVIAEGEEGLDVSIAPGGQQLLYTAFFTVGSRYDVVMTDLEGQPFESTLSQAPSIVSYSESEMGSFSADGNRITFIGEIGSVPRAVVVVALNGTIGDGLTAAQMTNDTAEYTYPSLSPDGSQVVAVRTSTSVENPGTDLVVIDVESRTLTPLTTDLDAIEETTTAWSPDGSLIAYAADAGDGSGNDLYLMSPDNPGAGFKIEAAQSPAEELYPVFSPDGRYLAFASNRTGVYNIFIYNLAAQTLVQLTGKVEEDVFPGGWSN